MQHAVMHGRKGFSLVELAIVLVILGLVVGGTLSGLDLLRASNLKQIGTTYQKYQNAYDLFQEQYLELPGDFTRASDNWGAADGGDALGADCIYVKSSGTETCNGDGNGRIETSATPTPDATEGYRAWQHLASAGLLEGRYTGAPDQAMTAAPQARFAVRGENVPKGVFGQTGWFLHEPVILTGGAAWLWDGNHPHMLIFGAIDGDDVTDAPALRPEEAWSIDTKLDDGRPGLGDVLVYRDNANCTDSTNGADPAGAQYALSEQEETCQLVFYLD